MTQNREGLSSNQFVLASALTELPSLQYFKIKNTWLILFDTIFTEYSDLFFDPLFFKHICSVLCNGMAPLIVDPTETLY